MPPLRVEDVFRRHYAYVWRSLARLGVGAAQLDDATQDVFVVVHHRLAEFAGHAKLTTWLFEIVRRVALQYRRQRCRSPIGVAIPTDHRDPRPGPFEQMTRIEALELMQAWLDELDDGKRIVFVMAELEQLQGPEIADRLGMNLNTVYARLRGARRHLARRVRRLINLDLGVRPGHQQRRRAWIALGAKLDAVTAATAVTGSAIAGTSPIAGFGIGAAAMTLVLVLIPTPDTGSPHAAAGTPLAKSVPPARAETGHPAPPPSTAVRAVAQRMASLDHAPTASPRAAINGAIDQTPPRVRGAAKQADPDRTFADELALFERVQAAVRRGTNARALAHATTYLRRYPHGTFAAEARTVRQRLSGPR